MQCTCRARLTGYFIGSVTRRVRHGPEPPPLPTNSGLTCHHAYAQAADQHLFEGAPGFLGRMSRPPISLARHCICQAARGWAAGDQR